MFCCLGMSSQRAENLGGSWDAEWVRAYSRFEEEQRAQDESENARYSRRQTASPSGTAADPRHTLHRLKFLS